MQRTENREQRTEYENRWGFTLIEIVVAVSIFTIIALSLGATFISGAKIWQRAKDMSFFSHEALLNLEGISKELSGCINIPSIGFEGTHRELTFALLKNDSVVVITYSFSPLQKNLRRGERNLEDLSDTNKSFAEKKILSLEDFSLDFYYFDKDTDNYLWKNSWSKENGIPLAVKFKIKTKNEEFSKTIFIPAS